MNVKTQNGMGIVSKGITWKPNYGMGLPKSNGMGLKNSNGMGISQDKNYFKFNEYERKRKYLQMGSRKPSKPKPKPAPKENKEPVKKEETKVAEVQQPKATTDFSPRKKWGAAVATVTAASAFRNTGSTTDRSEKYKKQEKVVIEEPTTGLNGNSAGSISRTLSLFEQLLYV